MTKAEHQAREYAAEIADFLRRAGRPNAGACVISWQDQAARLHIERRRHNDAMQELLAKYYALRDGPGRAFDREGWTGSTVQEGELTKAEQQAREYAAEADAAVQTEDQWAAGIADFLRLAGRPNAGACVISWHDQAVRLHIERRRHNDAMAELLGRYYALRDKPREFNREGKPPAESSD